MDAISPTVLVSMPNKATIPNTTKIAVSEAGKAFVSFGIPQMMSMVKTTRPSRI